MAFSYLTLEEAAEFDWGKFARRRKRRSVIRGGR
jgi:hypothetical protein